MYLSKQYKLGIVSNFSGNLLKILTDFSLAQYFNFVIDSYHVGFNKPDYRIYHLAISHCGCDVREILFIGDNPDRDIIPPHSLGMKTVLINTLQAKSLADYTITSLVDLPAIIEFSHKGMV